MAVGWIGSHAKQHTNICDCDGSHTALTKCEWTIINLICVTFDISDRGEHKWHVSHADVSISPTLQMKRHAFFSFFQFGLRVKWPDFAVQNLARFIIVLVWFPINFVFGLRPNRNKSISINPLAAAYLLLASSQHTEKNKWNRWSLDSNRKQTNRHGSPYCLCAFCTSCSVLLRLLIANHALFLLALRTSCPINKSTVAKPIFHFVCNNNNALKYAFAHKLFQLINSFVRWKWELDGKWICPSQFE